MDDVADSMYNLSLLEHCFHVSEFAVLLYSQKMCISGIFKFVLFFIFF